LTFSADMKGIEEKDRNTALESSQKNIEKQVELFGFIDQKKKFELMVRAHAILVPSQAIQTGQSGQYIFVIKPDLTAEMRPVTIGASIGGETAVVKGMQAGERVVTDGQLRIIPGAQVTIKETP